MSYRKKIKMEKRKKTGMENNKNIPNLKKDKTSITILYYSKSYATSPSKGFGSNQVDLGGIVNF